MQPTVAINKIRLMFYLMLNRIYFDDYYNLLIQSFLFIVFFLPIKIDNVIYYLIIPHEYLFYMCINR